MQNNWCDRSKQQVGARILRQTAKHGGNSVGNTLCENDNSVRSQRLIEEDYET